METHYVFGGEDSYHFGGVNDLKFYGTLDQCNKYLDSHSFDWFHIVNSNLEIIRSKGWLRKTVRLGKELS